MLYSTVTLVLIRTYSLFNLERRDLRRRQVSDRSFDWGMGDGKERYMIKAWGPDEKESKLRSLVNGIYGVFLESYQGQINKCGANVSLCFL